MLNLDASKMSTLDTIEFYAIDDVKVTEVKNRHYQGSDITDEEKELLAKAKHNRSMKLRQRVLNEENNRAIMVFETKNDPVYFVVNSLADRNRAAYAMATERIADDWWAQYDLAAVKRDYAANLARISEAGAEYISLTDDEVMNLPDSIKVKAEEARSKYVKRKYDLDNRYSDDKATAELIEKLKNAKTPQEALALTVPKGVAFPWREYPLALFLIEQFRDYEYEGFSYQIDEMANLDF